MSKQADTVKFYTRRDTATTMLRKLGIKSTNYNDFIEVLADGRFACHIARAELSLKKPVKSTRPVKDKPAVRTGAISDICRTMILDGKTNAQIFTALQTKFGDERFDEGKRHYPGWYRCQMRRNGELPAALDTARQSKHAKG